MSRDHPGGIPLRPPPGWRPPVPPPPVRPLALASMAVIAMLVCGAAGWIAIRLPRRPAGSAPPVEEEKPSPHVQGRPLAFDRDVAPILGRACSGCHGRMRQRGGVDLSSLAAIKRGGDNGPILKPGNPDESALYESIASGRMPPKMPDAVKPDERRAIRDWIAGGAK
ncbi:MAG: hypothetical protein K2W96_24540 [Gemmataceae bacterium]|nr:hypothetical protein [Gemmataceae bacterium]